MTSFFGGGRNTTEPTPPATSLRIQSSVLGKVRPIGVGQTRIAGNLIWYGDFLAIPIQQAPAGGKGVGGGGGGKGAQGQVTYTYSAAVAIALGEGPITSIASAYNNKSVVTLASLNLSSFLGGYSQSAWGYLV